VRAAFDAALVLLVLLASGGCKGAPDLRTTAGREEAAEAAAAPHEAAARDAEAAKNPREALQHYLAAIQTQPQGFITEKDFELRASAIRLYLTLDPPPVDADEALHAFDRADEIANTARDEARKRAATAEYERGLRLTPWNAKANYNAGVLAQSIGSLDLALDRLKLYLLAAPEAPDKREVGRTIARIEVKIEQSGPGRLVGDWKLWDGANDATWYVGSPGYNQVRVSAHWCPDWHIRLQREGDHLAVIQHFDRDHYTFGPTPAFLAGAEATVAQLSLNERVIDGVIVTGDERDPGWWCFTQHPGGRVTGTVSEDGQEMRIDVQRSRGMPGMSGYAVWNEPATYRRWSPDMEGQ
jgi:tetratricopeptide (TPR) repeat protein